MEKGLKVSVTSEVGRLRRLLVHSPDSGLGKVIPAKAQDLLYEDIVHLDTIRSKEYDYYTKILLYFLDYDKIKGKLYEIDSTYNKRRFYIPNDPSFYKSDKVVELQWLLKDILTDEKIKIALVSAICSAEGCSYATTQSLINYAPDILANTLISGSDENNLLIFKPITNLIFTRDIGITINNYILLTKPAKAAREREGLLAKYIFFNHPLFAEYNNNVIELSDSEYSFLIPSTVDEKRFTIEGGDLMLVSKNHLLVGVSERTTYEGAAKIVSTMFEKNIVDKVTIVKIPKKRDYMHLDTVFTQVKRNVWVMHSVFSNEAIKKMGANVIENALELNKEEKVKITQFLKTDPSAPVKFETLEDLIRDISKNDLKCDEDVKIIFSGNNEYISGLREQWTDSCNLLALKEGVVLAYDRNDKTTESFAANGFKIIKASDLIEQLEAGTLHPDTITDTFVLMPSGELSRARGGFHCMSMPILRDDID